MRLSCCGRPAAVLLIVLTASLQADTFTWRDRGEARTTSGTLIASGRGVHIICEPDGGYVVVPEQHLQSRTPGEDSPVASAQEVAEGLKERFGADRIRLNVDAPYVVGIVLAGPLADGSGQRAEAFLLRAMQFMQNVEMVFTRFCRELRLSTFKPIHPLVMLIFETDRDFEEYARGVSNGAGLSAENMAGFYSPMNNHLAVRMIECRSFQVPLHEAIHQQTYNRGLLQRLAEIPVWFNEGLATGFENDGERINIGPTKISATYARQIDEQSSLGWDRLCTDDSVFSGDVLSGAAYVDSWALHWLLVSQHRRRYSAYVQQLGRIQPLEQMSSDERMKQFVECFGKSPAQLQEEFPRQLEAGLKRQKVRLSPPAGQQNIAYSDASEVELTAVQRTDDGHLQVAGRLHNISPFRDFSYYVTVRTDGGLYADWHLHSVESLSSCQLRQKEVTKLVQGGPGELGTRVWVEVVCALPSSEEAERWRRGHFPAPRWASTE